MKTKFFSTMSSQGLEREVNKFLAALESKNNEIIEVQFSTALFTYSALIIYK